jgi:transcriptional regulator with XRE-family HTH domain
MSAPTLSIFAERLRIHRNRLDLSQTELADRLGKSQASVSEWERAASAPQVQELLLLCALFDCSADYLIGRADHPHGLPAGMFLIDLDKVEGDHVPDEDWGFQVPRRAKVVDWAEVRRIQAQHKDRIRGKKA